MKILIIDTADVADGYFNIPLTQAVSQFTDCTTVNYQTIDSDKPIIGHYDGVVVSGVPLHYSFESIKARERHLKWIRDTTLPVLGICFGHQVMGELFGAQVIENLEAEDELCQLHIVADDPLIQNLGPDPIIKANHRGSINVPDEFRLLASSAKCQNHIMRHATRHLYGCQFHPELSDHGKIILKNFVGIVAATGHST